MGAKWGCSRKHRSCRTGDEDKWQSSNIACLLCIQVDAFTLTSSRIFPLLHQHQILTISGIHFGYPDLEDDPDSWLRFCSLQDAESTQPRWPQWPFILPSVGPGDTKADVITGVGIWAMQRSESVVVKIASMLPDWVYMLSRLQGIYASICIRAQQLLTFSPYRIPLAARHSDNQFGL